MNLVPNGDFRSLAGWKLSNPALIQLGTDTADGVPRVKLSSDPHASDGSESTAIWQFLDIKGFDAKAEYRLRFRAKSDHFPQEYNLFLGMMQGEQLPFTVGYEWRQVGSAWQDVRLDFRDVNPVATAIKLMIQVKAPGSVWISDLRIEQLPAGTIGAEERLLKDLPKFVGSSQNVRILADRRFEVNGKPFFPIGLWGIDYPNERQMDDLQSYGFNITGTGHLSARGANGVKAFLDQLQIRGLMAIGVMRYALTPQTPEIVTEVERMNGMHKPVMEITRLHPAFFAYDIGDEVAWAGNDISALAKGAHYIRECDPHHPIFTNAAPRGSIASLQRYYRFADIGGSDIYPWWNGEPDKHSDLPNKSLSVVGDETVKNLQAMGKNKPVMMTLQAFGWSEGTPDEALKAKGYTYPPQNLIRYMVYDAIVCGATGILMFQDGRYDYINRKVKAIGLELKAMHNVLASPNDPKGAKSADKRLKLITKLYRGKRIIIAVNQSESGMKCRITVPAGTKVWLEKATRRKLDITRQGFTESFEPWGVGIYEQMG